MNSVPIERIASQLREAPFYIKEDNIDFYLIVENAYKCLKEMRMLPLKRQFKIFTVSDYKVDLGPHYAVNFAVRISSRALPTVGDLTHPNQIYFDELESVLDTTETPTQLDDLKRVMPHVIGEYIDYAKEGKCLVFKETDIEVGIGFNGMVLDSRGYIEIPEQCEQACVYYIAWIYFVGEFMANRLDGQRLQYFEKLKEQKISEARLDHRMSKNELDKVMNVLTSFDRKAYGWAV